jgi:hypothetical protein
VLAQLFCQQRLTDLASLSHLRDDLQHCQALNLAVQDYLRAWGRVSARRNPAVMLDQASVPWFVELNRSLQDRLDDAAFRARIHAATQRLHALAAELLARGTQDHPTLDGRALQALLPAGTVLPHESMLFARTHAAPAAATEVAV